MAKKKRKKPYLSSKRSKGRAIRAIAKNTKGGKGKIKNRKRYKKTFG